MQLTT